jgi:hypothetical protein
MSNESPDLSTLDDNTPIADLTLSVRAWNVLNEAGFKTVGDVKEFAAQGKYIRLLKGCGKKSEQEICRLFGLPLMLPATQDEIKAESDITTLDREALARMVRDLQFRLRQDEGAALDLIGQRDRFESEIEDIYRALGGEGEWTAKLPPQPPPDSGDLAADALELARRLVAQLAAARAEAERLTKQVSQLRYGHAACPCLHTTPCDPDCTCVSSISSRGCARCCSYGSIPQQRAKAERLAGLDDENTRLTAELAEVKQHDQRLQILCGELCAVGVEGVSKASTAAIEIQDRIEGLEAENARLRAALAQVGNAVKQACIEACRVKGWMAVVARIEQRVNIAAIVAASAETSNE